MQGFTLAFRALLSANFKAFRAKHNLTQEAMAALLRISSRSYSDLEHGKFLCSTPVFISYLNALSEDEALLLLKQMKSTAKQTATVVA